MVFGINSMSCAGRKGNNMRLIIIGYDLLY